MPKIKSARGEIVDVDGIILTSQQKVIPGAERKSDGHHAPIPEANKPKTRGFVPEGRRSVADVTSVTVSNSPKKEAKKKEETKTRTETSKKEETIEDIEKILNKDKE